MKQNVGNRRKKREWCMDIMSGSWIAVTWLEFFKISQVGGNKIKGNWFNPLWSSFPELLYKHLTAFIPLIQNNWKKGLHFIGSYSSDQVICRSRSKLVLAVAGCKRLWHVQAKEKKKNFVVCGSCSWKNIVSPNKHHPATYCWINQTGMYPLD